MGNKTLVVIISLISLTSLLLLFFYGYSFEDLRTKVQYNSKIVSDSQFISAENFLRVISSGISSQRYSNFSKVNGDARSDVQPEYRGAPRLCPSPTERISCSSVMTEQITSCIKMSAVGLCGGWSKKLRELPANFRCPKLSNTRIILDHVDKPESIADSDIVLFTFQASYLGMDVWQKLRRYRPLGQMWVFQTEESPFYAVGLLPPWMYRADTYNISNTYHRGADIYSPYGYYEPYRSEESHMVTNISEVLENKSRFMVWISSHCETLQWDRTKYVNDLRKVMDVDIFGRCGKNTLCKERWGPNCSRKVDALIGSYKFYLAIENSCCEDYITEKLWHAYSIGTIPVVLGPRIENYEKLAPPGSFIHLDQFESAQDLRGYLEYLDNNETAYLEYFEWRTKGIVKEHSMEEHYKSHSSDGVLCSVVEQHLMRKNSPEIKTRMFDPYGAEWKGTCHECGVHQWIRDYEYTMDHERTNKWIWAR